jgi:hypothetical protein
MPTNYDRNLMEENLLAFRWLCRIAHEGGNKQPYLAKETLTYLQLCVKQWPKYRAWHMGYCYKYNLAGLCGEGE